MTQSIMKAASNPESVTKGKKQSESTSSYFVSRASWAAMATAAIGIGAGAVFTGYKYLTSKSDTVQSVGNQFAGGL